MSRRIAVTMRVVQAQNYYEPRDAISHDWIRYLDSRGLAPFLVPNALPDPVKFVRTMEPAALVLTNGEDVAAEPDHGGSPISPEFGLRDATERQLLSYAVSTRLPVLGVCRGMQLINVYFGGTIRQNLAAEPSLFEQHVASEHSVEILESLSTVLKSRHMRVNSFHNHGVTLSGLAPDFVAGAVARGGTVEACRHRSLPIWGIQWHPERPNPAYESDALLIQRWLDEAGQARM